MPEEETKKRNNIAGRAKFKIITYIDLYGLFIAIKA